tara:strand:- start:403 stop:552 length:150 start_codon:yes stop_codon:yes gene_type:complete
MKVRKTLISGKKYQDDSDDPISNMGEGVTTGKSKDLLKRIIRAFKNFKW